MKPGIRVIRGPDWSHYDDDGGYGYLGTVTKVLLDNTVRVTWDVGNETICRAGPDGAFDLRIFDNSPSGVSHGGVRCDICGENIEGMRWKCLVCNDYDECTMCYLGIGRPVTHDTRHPFVRMTAGRSKVVRVAPRRVSKQTPIYGIFPGAEVTEARRDLNKKGIVRKTCRIDRKARSGVKVEWNDLVNTNTARDGTKEYRVGAGGNVDLKMIKPGTPCNVYIEHLPVLDLTMPLEDNLEVGDLVRVELNLETFKALQGEYVGWNDELEQILGEDGKVTDDCGRNVVRVKFNKQRNSRIVYASALTKIYKVSPCDIVHVTSDRAKLRALQIGHGGWKQSYKSILGKRGEVVRIEESGCAVLDIQGETFTLNPECLTVNPDLVNNPGVSVDVGARVVRGPDWSSDFADQDGGEGHLGSIVELCGQTAEDTLYPRDCAVIQWDNGERNVYRAGYEKAYDLRMLDNAGIGVKHAKSCDGCEDSIVGLLWTCQQCPSVSLCTGCYGDDKHDINHTFTRFDHTSDDGVNVPRRRVSKKIATKGIFEKSKVQRGPDWRWANQDGGVGKEGEVIAIVNFSPDTEHDAAEVTWQNGYTNVYRLGYRGRLDLKCMRPVRGGYYYRDHLPILKLNMDVDHKPEVQQDVKVDVKPAETKPASPTPAPSTRPVTSQGPSSDEAAGSTPTQGRFKSGDRVRIEIDVDILKMMEENRGSWRPEMTDCIGKVGSVIVGNSVEVTVDFEGAGRWTFSESVLNKVKEFQKGEIVKVIDSLSHVRKLQTERGGWNEMMSKVLGRKGRVDDIDEDGDVVISFGFYNWTLNPECLLESEGPPDILRESDDEPEPKPKPSSGPPKEDGKQEEFFGTIFAGDNERFARMIERDPQLMLMEYKGQFAIHQAAVCGNIEIVTSLLHTAGKETQLENTDNEGNTPLLSATKGGSMEMVKHLVDSGCKKDATNKNSETAVHIAVANKSLSMLKQLRDLNFDINLKNALKQSPLFEAIVMDEPEMFATILSWPGLDATLADSIGFTPFTAACRSGNKMAVLGILENYPEELNRQKEDGFAGLHVAVYNKRTETVQVLLNQPRIQIDLVTKEGKTPLHIACEFSQLDIARLLIGKGADPRIPDKNSKTCLHLCAESTLSQDNKRPAILGLAKLLLENNVGADSRDSSGKLAVDYLTPGYRDEFTDLVTKHGASRPRGSSDPPQSLPPNVMSDGKPNSPASSVSTDTKGQHSQQTATGRQDPAPGVDDSELCEACDEEPVRFRLEPCRHLLCGDCVPPKKAKNKFCYFCRETVEEVIEFDQR